MIIINFEEVEDNAFQSIEAMFSINGII